MVVNILMQLCLLVPEDYMGLKNRLREERINAGYNTAKEFCTKYRIPYTTYTQHENGSRQMTIEILDKYAGLLNKKYWDLIRS